MAIGYVFSVSRTLKKVRFFTHSSAAGKGLKNFTLKRYNGGAWAKVPILSASEGCEIVNTDEGMVSAAVNGWCTVVCESAADSQFRLEFSSKYNWTAGANEPYAVTELKMWATPQDVNANALDITETGAGVGINAPQAKFDICHTGDGLALKVLRSGTGATDAIATFHSNIGGVGTKVCEIRNTGGVYNIGTVFGGLSDERFKENITDSTPKLEELRAVRVRKFNFIGHPEFPQIGMIAQELEGIFPGLVTGTEDTETIPDPDWIPGAGQTETDRPFITRHPGTVTKSIKYSVFVPILIKALQELAAKNDALETRVAALEARQ
ncbi:MAG: tail fiber domain-containing protein [Magnetococcales bacterium]|nr:tail fiber domain-containing protein [Magnetococcales bacterium]